MAGLRCAFELRTVCCSDDVSYRGAATPLGNQPSHSSYPRCAHVSHPSNRSSVPSFLTAAVLVLALCAAMLSLFAPPAAAQSGPDSCPEVSGISCQGFIPDVDGVLQDRLALEESASRIVDTYGHEVAIVLVGDAPGGAESLARDIGETWVVKDRDGQAGGVVVVVDTENDNGWITAGPNVQNVIPSSSVVFGTAGPSFRNGDWDAGTAAILGTLEASFENELRGSSGSIGGGTTSAPTSSEPSTNINLLPLVLFGGIGFAAFAGRGSKTSRTRHRSTEKDRRGQEVDDVLDRLETLSLIHI